jgi:hypothetical protein
MIKLLHLERHVTLSIPGCLIDSVEVGGPMLDNPIPHFNRNLHVAPAVVFAPTKNQFHAYVTEKTMTKNGKKNVVGSIKNMRETSILQTPQDLGAHTRSRWRYGCTFD